MKRTSKKTTLSHHLYSHQSLLHNELISEAESDCMPEVQHLGRGPRLRCGCIRSIRRRRIATGPEKHKDTRDKLAQLLASTVWRVSRWLRRTHGPSVERGMRFGDADEDACRPRRMSSVYYTSSAREKRRPTTTGLATTSATEDTRLLVSVLVSVLHEKTCRCRKSECLPSRKDLYY